MKNTPLVPGFFLIRVRGQNDPPCYVNIFHFYTVNPRFKAPEKSALVFKYDAWCATVSNDILEPFPGLFTCMNHFYEPQIGLGKFYKQFWVALTRCVITLALTFSKRMEGNLTKKFVFYSPHTNTPTPQKYPLHLKGEKNSRSSKTSNCLICLSSNVWWWGW